MQSVKDFTDQNLKEEIIKAQEDMDNAEYGTSDYNAAVAELHVAYHEAKRRRI